MISMIIVSHNILEMRSLLGILDRLIIEGIKDENLGVR